MTTGSGVDRAAGGAGGSTRLEAILAAIMTPVVLIIVAAVLPRSRDAWGIPPRGTRQRGGPSPSHGSAIMQGQKEDGRQVSAGRLG